MRRFIFVFLSLLFASVLLPGVMAENPQDAILTAREAVLDITLGSTIYIEPGSSNYRLSEVNVESMLFPRDTYRQSVSDFRTIPEDYTKDDDAVKLSWSEPSGNAIDYAMKAKIETDGSPIEVRRKIAFPVEDDFSPEVEYYTQASEHIDSEHPNIEAKANELTEGIDDYYEAVFELATWVNSNIDYNLSTLDEEVSKRSSWVLENRRGVCAEMTSLFVAMSRSLGIPARYVSGFAYTNSPLFDFNWGAHGWAEIYFPRYGWVPFDVTYGEYGFIGPSHVELRKTLDSADPGSYYSWYGYDVQLRGEEMSIDSTILEIEEWDDDAVLDLDISTEYDVVEFGSYNLIRAEVKNNRDFYVPATFRISETQHADILDDTRQEVLFGPEERRTLFWTVQVDDDLSQNYEFRLPFEVVSSTGVSATDEITTNAFASGYDLSDIERAKEETQQLETGSPLGELRFVCEFLDDVYYPDDDHEMVCQLSNVGEAPLENLDVCMEDECSEIDIAAGESKDISFFPEDTSIGERNIVVTVEMDEYQISEEVSHKVVDFPEVTIDDIEVPDKVEFGDEFQLIFKIHGDRDPRDLRISVNLHNLERSWTLDSMSRSREFTINVGSRELLPGSNEFNIEVYYKDARGEEYSTSSSVEVELTEVPWLNGVIMRVRSWLESLIS